MELLEENRSNHQESVDKMDLKPQVIVSDERSTIYNRIISKDVREYHFIVPYTERVEIGAIFSIEDRTADDKITFLARITDIQHASNYGGNWDTILRGDDFYDKDHIFNKVVAEPLGCVTRDGFKKPRTIPSKFSPVKRAGKEELKFLIDEKADIEVGSLRNGSQAVEDIPVSLRSEAMDHHMGVFATTGMGKSNFMKVFAASCIKRSALGTSKFGLLIVDPHGEYLSGSGYGSKGLLDIKYYKDSGLVCYSTDPRHIKHFHGAVTELKVKKEDIKPADIETLYDWNSTQKEALDVVSRALTRNWLDEILTEDGMNILKEEGVHLRTIEKINKNIRTIRYKNESIIDNIKSSVPGIIKNLQEGKVVLIDIPNLSERSELFLLSLISSRILEKYRRDVLEGTGKNCCLITIEEAQRVLGGGEGSLTRFESIAREGRKFGVGLCAITQQPKLINKQLLSQFNTFVILGLADRNDRTRLEESAKQDLSSLDIEIQTLETGEAIISTLGIPFPIPAKFHKYEHYLKKLNDPNTKDKKLEDDLDNSFDPEW